MSFIPISGTSINSATIGVGSQPKILEDKLMERDRLYDRRLHESDKNNVHQSNKHLIVIIIISAIIFVTVIAIFDVIKQALNNYFSK